MAVEDILKTVNIPFQEVRLGEIEVKNPLNTSQQQQLEARLNKIGFNLIDNKGSNVIEKIKQITIRKARNQLNEKEARLKLSTLITDKLHYEYSYLSNLFSSIENRTIENYFIEQRIEYAKELLVYGELTLSAIALELEYSSTAHLSAQFKKITGLTPTYFKQIGADKRKTLDQV
jgi:AraC-like DNA-binding protein